jgi:NifB/MoaA-like Fe-S oxidoreductase
MIHKLQVLFKQKYKENIVFPSDEFYRLADLPFPPVDAYGDFPQWENGVGMVSLFRHAWRNRGRQETYWKTGGTPDCLIVTGEAAFPIVLPYVEWLRHASGSALRLVPVRNRFFGRSVNVAGLITGRDVIDRIRPLVRGDAKLFVPDVMLSRDGNRFLDNVSLTEIQQALGVKAWKFSADPTGFERVLRNCAKGL